MSSVIVLPKMSIDGKAKMTSILASEITGVEPAKIVYNGKTYQGSKCYTVHGNSFKVFSDPSQFAANWVLARNQTSGVLPVDSLIGSLPGYTSEVKNMKKLMAPK